MNPPISQGMPQATPAPIHDIVDAVSLPSTPLWLWITGGALLVLLAAFLIWWFFLRHRKAELTPRQKALLSLGQLASAGVSGYEFAVKVSEVLRSYIQQVYGLRATTQTSLEFLEAIQENHVFSEEEKKAMADFLETADLVKFARQDLGETENARLRETALAVVQRGEEKKT